MAKRGNLEDVQKKHRKVIQEVQKEQKMREQMNESTSELKRKEVENCMKNALLTQEESNRTQIPIDVTAAADISAIAGPSSVMEASLSPTAQDSHGQSMADEAVESLSKDLHDA
ncbi:uncharacterized protein LOC117171810 [Belonocnema kinseyi]|uniref:uncharacterized protein LOC117171810 n=1 Tax=Belonocnema kinseyi TaxID=2817044 RepID=UPI00143DDF1A|nr:uncharacterized protein LOC117171810 [Belonocnema kinseyi]